MAKAPGVFADTSDTNPFALNRSRWNTNRS